MEVMTEFMVSGNQLHLPTSVGEMRLSRPADWLDTPLAVEAPDAMATCIQTKWHLGVAASFQPDVQGLCVARLWIWCVATF